MRHLALAAAALLALTAGARAADQIKIGLVNPLSGPVSPAGQELKRGFDLAMEELGNKLQLTLNFTPTLTQQTNVSLNFDLPNLGIPSNSNLPGVTDFTGSAMTVTPTANFNLVLDIDLTSPTSPVYDLDSGTQFVLGLLINGPSSGTVGLGPLGLTFAGATLALSSTSSSSSPATYTVGLKSTTPISTLKTDLTNSTWLGASGPVA